jgi:SPOR domain
MRLAFLLLVFANIAFFGYASHLSAGRGEAQLQLLQISPERVKLVKDVAPPPPKPAPEARVAAPAPAACLAWGPLDAEARPRAEAALAPLALGDRLTVRESTPSYWVHVPPLKSKAEAEKRAGELKARGVTEYYIVPDEGPAKFAISLGLFKSEQGASDFLAQLREKGVRSAVVAMRGGESAILIRDPGDAAAARVVEIAKDFPGSGLKVLPCPEPGKG